jgi:hypothetical protein
MGSGDSSTTVTAAAPAQAQLQLDLGVTSRRVARVAPSIEFRPTADGRGVEMRTRSGAPELWISTAEACARSGLDREVLYGLGRSGEIEGRQPNKPIADIAANRATNHKWEWLAMSVADYVERQRAARLRLY